MVVSLPQTGPLFIRTTMTDNIAEAITGYIDFCVDTVTTKRTIKSYPNNKDYITPQIKQSLQRKLQAFRSNNVLELKCVQKELRVMLRKVREHHSLPVREAFSNKNCKQLWDSVKDILNFKKGEALHVLNEMETANELNDLYLRFDCDANGVFAYNGGHFKQQRH